MSKNKIKKEISQSERKKYLRTMMADLGVTSLKDMPSDEARKSLLRATEPRPCVKKRLKDMGYDFSGNKNKRSLGTLNIKLATPTLDSSIDSAIAIRKLVGTNNYRGILPNIFPREWSRSQTLQAYKTDIVKNLDPNIYSQNKEAIDKLIRDIFDYLVEYNQDKASPAQLREYLSVDGNVVAKGHKYSGDIKIIQKRLEILGFLSTGYNPGSYDIKTESAVKSFQLSAGLPETGSVDYTTFVSLGRSDILPQKASVKRPSAEGASEEFGGDMSRSFKKDLSYLSFKNPGGFTGIKDDTLKFLYIINDLAKEEGVKITITSMYRGPYDQARIMLDNYSRRGIGSQRAGKYLKRLYRRYPNVDQIVEIFAGSGDVESKRQRAAQVIKQTWPKVGHLSGESVDIVPRNEQVRRVLQRSQEFAEVNILDEGNHFHTAVKSLTPGGTRGKLIA